jgi:predicted SAM-dependent methyltransferase
LEVGGVIRLVVPDAGKYLRAYCKGDWEELSAIRPLDSEGTDFYLKCKYNTKMELINSVFRHGEEHRFAYDYETLNFLLLKYCFSVVQQQEFGNSFKEYLCLERQERASESIYVEAIK